MPPETQAKVLRVLQERSFERVGGSKPIDVDVRVIAATHRNLEEEVRKQRFREDLYYRLKVVTLELPPLRERAEDIPALAQRFLERVIARLGREKRQLGDAALARLVRHRWPGNVRELRNVIEQAAVLASGPVIEEADLQLGGDPGRADGALGAGGSGLQLRRRQAQRRRELRARLPAATRCARSGGNISRAAEAIGHGAPEPAAEDPRARSSRRRLDRGRSREGERMSTQSRGLLGRLFNLIRGVFAVWIRDGEEQNPRAVYESAIEERTRQYHDLKQAVAGILYMRNKLEAEISERRAEIARLHDDVRRAVRRGQDEIAVTLIAQKQALLDELERSERELEGVRAEAEDAKNNLVRFREEIRALVREKGRMLATLANAQAPARIQQALEGLSVDAEMRALESVREHIGSWRPRARSSARSARTTACASACARSATTRASRARAASSRS